MTKLAVVELKLLTREPGAMFSLLIPLFILVIFGSSIEPGDTVLLPMALAIAVGLVGLYMLPTTMATYRERGILRRLSTTPVRPASMLVVQLVLQFVLAMVACGLLLTVAGTVLGAQLPSRGLLIAVTFLLGTAGMFAIGLLIAALAPNGRAANGVGVLLYFPMAFLAGLIQPTDQMPVILAHVGKYTPLGAFRQSLQDVWAGGAPDPLLLVVMAAYALVISIAAARFFRWE
ncbi:ABC transporter permease [Streptosporangium roseum]|uniref:Transport permease protein n=1 Tax=Streptosporangium roseum (strain ATCC 12428 / DSM 43021 / JCM 3005 / KCTC 9067 / NCIMB 10171 / NRRL 2505 / NI 9100) TaxID=479432 RepID=D2AZC2_STRRD|nr:ABC transporter permease [Streptosporangium roseum]ACZ83307.1 ABC-2 type transporter [Streptosporangium roseum DSM 43021]